MRDLSQKHKCGDKELGRLNSEQKVVHIKVIKTFTSNWNSAFLKNKIQAISNNLIST